MSDEALRVEFQMAMGNRWPAPKSDARAERQRVNRAARRARNLALAYWIDHLVRSTEVANLAAVARMCGISRARVVAIEEMLGTAISQQESWLQPSQWNPNPRATCSRDTNVSVS